jgi:hypothetical protein
MKKIKNTTKIFLLAFLTISLSLLFSFHLSSGSFVQGQENDIEALEQKEQEREDGFLSQLLLDIPVQTDNPSHIITFVDPSETKEGVQLEIDDKGFNEIQSPYSLPALGIGRHELKFRFVDRYGSPQILEKDIVIIPRPPIINSPVFQEEFLLITGTGLSNSEVVLILSSDRAILVKQADIDTDGNWQVEISNEDLREGIFTFTAFTRRYGYASNLAEPTTFEIGESERFKFDNSKEIYFSFKNLSTDNIGKVLTDNIDLGLLVGGSFILGFFVSLLIFSFTKGILEDRSVKMFERKMRSNGENNEKMTLKERLSKKEEVEDEEAEEEEEVKEEKKAKEEKPKEKKKKKKTKKKKKEKTEKIVSKVDFLKDYKKFDPDDDQGKEKDNLEVKVKS